MKKTVALMDKLLALARGEALPASQLRGDWFVDMHDEGILVTIAHGSRSNLRALDGDTLRRYLSEKYGIVDLEQCRDLLAAGDASRAAQVAVTGNSKFVSRRTFQGFLVNSYAPVPATLHGEPLVVSPPEGSFLFISDYADFRVSPDVIVIGIENAENFRYIHRQRHLFAQHVPQGAAVLFVCRYPQSGDLVKWLRTIPNRYLHFGDLDLAGIHIYQSEFHRHLGSRSSFLIPDDYEERIRNGSPERYTEQYQKYRNMPIADPRLQPLVDCIHRYHRGYDQEGFIE